MFELIPVRVDEAANEAWLGFTRQEVTVTRLGEYTKVVLTKPANNASPVSQPAWA